MTETIIPIVKFQYPVKCKHCRYEFNNSRALDQHMESDHETESVELSFTCPKLSCPKKFKTDSESLDHFVMDHNMEKLDNEEVDQSTPATTLKLDYVLNELKNVKTAKANSKRPMTVERNVINDLNTRYNLNSSLFLVVKEDIDKFQEGNQFHNDVSGVSLEVVKVTKQLDKKDNNPVTVVKWKVSDSKKNWVSNVTMNMYHTNQGVHFQGGETNGDATTCSLAGDFFEEMCRNTIMNKSARIAEINDMLSKLDARKKYGSQPIKQKKILKEDNLLKCDHCHYKTVTKTELKRHMFLTHQKRPHPTTMKSVSFKLTGIQKTKEADREVKLDSECLKCYRSFKTEEELDIHEETVHKPEEDEKAKSKDDATQLLNQLWEENAVLLKAQADNNAYLEQLKIREQEMIKNATTMKGDIKFLIKGKQEVEVAYQAASKAVAE